MTDPGTKSKSDALSRDDHRSSRLTGDDGEFAADRQPHIRELSLDPASCGKCDYTNAFPNLRQTEWKCSNLRGGCGHRIMPLLRRVTTRISSASARIVSVH
jgi:hypothetical protein